MMAGKPAPHSGWTQVAFGDVVERASDSGIPTSEESATYIGLEHLDADSFAVRRWGSDVDIKVPKTRVRKGDVLFARRNTHLRRCAIAPFDTFFSPDGYAFRSKSPHLLDELLLFIVASDNFMDFAVRHSAGTHSKRVKWSDLQKYELALPPIQEQSRIAEVLTRAHELAENRVNLQLQLRQVRESWLEEEFMVLARDWPQRLSSELIDRITVGIVVKPAALYIGPEDGGVPALRSLNVLPHKIVTDELVYISEAGHEGHAKSRLCPGDVVVVRSGRPGDAAVIPEGIGELNCIDLIICGPSEHLDPQFFCAALNARFGRRQFAAGTAGTAQKHFNVGALKQLRVPVPPLDVQRSFLRDLRSFDLAAAKAEEHIRISRELIRGLIREVLPS